ncbi:MAG TPA: hypothetical protein VMW75_00220 [Thermoanaerobaculia bacterium]|nr:hypothetical protein [Thermoanaerobaculia bacterium]
MIQTERLSFTGARRALVFLAAGAAFAAVPALAARTAAAAPPAPRPIEIGAARLLPLGTVVTVEGAVTVPSGLLSSGGSLDQGFAIQDRTGGIYVSVATNLGLTLRQRVQVTGALAAANGFLILVPASAGDVEVRGRGPRVKPLWLRTGSVGPANQGLLVRVVGVITQPVAPDPPFGNQVVVDDGSGPVRIFVNTSTGIDVSGLAPGQLLSVTGLSDEFDTPEIDPRFQSDLRQPADR